MSLKAKLFINIKFDYTVALPMLKLEKTYYIKMVKKKLLCLNP